MVVSNWDYKNGLPPLQKKRLDDKFELLDNEVVLKTNIDEFPYLVELLDMRYLEPKVKFSITGEAGLYTVKSVDLEKQTLEAKMDKTLDLTGRTVAQVRSYYDGWGMKKEAEKIKANYIWKDMRFNIMSNKSFIELNIDGKISKNQVVQYRNAIIKITDLIKNEEGLIEIHGEPVDRYHVQAVFPYKKNGEFVCWYEDVVDVWLRQAVEYNEK